MGRLSKVVVATEGLLMNHIMVISPHPDDESIGCGGTILKHVAEGDVVQIELLTSGEKGGHDLHEADVVRIREQEAAAVAEILGVEYIEFYRQPDGHLRVSRPLASRLAQRIRDCKPSIIYAPHAAEQHPDHRVIVRLLQCALRLLDLDEPPRVLAYEVWTPLQQLDEIVDITPYIETKLKAIAAYSSQMRIMDFAAAAEGLARYRGEMHCWPGGEFAEVFAELTRVVSRSYQKQ
jgi:LmbE family N-acetylglucosaminyl deacetylase